MFGWNVLPFVKHLVLNENETAGLKAGQLQIVNICVHVCFKHQGKPYLAVPKRSFFFYLAYYLVTGSAAQGEWYLLIHFIGDYLHVVWTESD